jgi:tRNA A64-2'-O-ribosylphosphate transferase
VKGLTPELFWKHKRDILEASRAELPRLISSVVSTEYTRDNGNPPSPITRVDGRILICAVSDLSSRDLIRTCDFTNTAFLLLTSRNTEQGDVLPAFFSGMTILQIQVTEGKKGQNRFLEDVLPRSVDYVRQQLRGDKRVCVACNSGQDVSVGVALSALQQFFDDEGRYVASELDTPRKLTRHNSFIIF